MGFSEKNKLEVKERAAFKCCRCQSIGVQVHHIIQPKDGGTDDIDNAAPLCGYCHTEYGDNPKKRKEITQMRDWWYKTVEKMYPNEFMNVEILNKINTKLEKIENKNKSGFSELKQILTSLTTNLIENMKPETASKIATGIITGIELTGSTFMNVQTNFVCKYCGTMVGIMIGSNKCPGCGQPIK